MQGIDISSWQGDFDLSKYQGKFVIIRAGAGSTLDKKAVRNMNECERLGIPYGVYWYSYALSAAAAEAEAELCIKAIKGRNIEVGVWFDMEDADSAKKNNGFKFTKTNVSKICNAFCRKVEAAGYYAGIYSSASWFGSLIDCPDYDHWVASWGKNTGARTTDTSNMGSLHQYTSKPLDKDVMYVPISTFQPKQENDSIKYKAFIDGDGWMGKPVQNGEKAGKPKSGKQLQAFRVYPPKGLELTAFASVEGKPWKTYKNITPKHSRVTIGSTWQGLRLEAFELRADKNDTGKKLRYRAYCHGSGWTAWVNSGHVCGSAGSARYIEAIEIELK